ncbi:master regulator for biofilm formation [[Clostridium] ultunense Esp]|uniref:RicAFT regulatory complex protein RicA family protein n=1 Tax=Thermicanus aegyptius TaxID=94009 RepID=UPI0002B704A6|nr:YlbF family regulator [Thermicanus aegyptius]CCQ98525.1 master regulator for biofilm formation [[Clostridium] ultunense Esp]
MNKERLVTREEILDKARELADLISRSDEVDFFKKAEQKIKKNMKVQLLIGQIKGKQKEAVHAEHYGTPQHLAEVEKEIERLNQELDEIPVVQEFKQSQVEVNDLLQLITNIISNTVTEKIILSTGGDPLTGKTGILPDEE